MLVAAQAQLIQPGLNHGEHRQPCEPAVDAVSALLADATTATGGRDLRDWLHPASLPAIMTGEAFFRAGRMSIVAFTRDDGTVNGQGGDLAFVRVLGPVQVVTASRRSVDLPSASQRRLVALLATEASRSLRADWICDVLAVSPGALRTTVSRVRRTVGDGMIAGSQGRYRLAVPVDAALFTSALSQV